MKSVQGLVGFPPPEWTCVKHRDANTEKTILSEKQKRLFGGGSKTFLEGGFVFKWGKLFAPHPQPQN